MPELIKLSATFSVVPSKVYNAWLNTEEHSSMKGEKATASPKVGGKFTAWDNYIYGKNIDLKKNKRIIQTWRGTDFPAGADDSILIIRFDKSGNGTKITLIHSEIPDGMGKNYAEGWREYYFKPMKKYFGK